MWVVKLGGSMLGSPELSSWLEVLVKISDGKVLIVPGGGLFADAVREAQQRAGMTDEVAHHLALLAMDQFGLLLAGMHPGLVTASSELEIAERGWQHRAIVWLPSQMVMADDAIPKNWGVTSDSLSAWVANKIGAANLVLVKSKALQARECGASILLKTLVDDDWLDASFTDFYSGEDLKAWLLNKTDYALFEQGLNVSALRQRAIAVLK